MPAASHFIAASARVPGTVDGYPRLPCKEGVRGAHRGVEQVRRGRVLCHPSGGGAWEHLLASRVGKGRRLLARLGQGTGGPRG